MKLLIFLTALCIFILESNENEQSPRIIVLGSPTSTNARGYNANVYVSNRGDKITVISTSLGSIEINNEFVDSKMGYVVEGNDKIDGSPGACKTNSKIPNIIIKCSGKLIVRHKTAEDFKIF